MHTQHKILPVADCGLAKVLVAMRVVSTAGEAGLAELGLGTRLTVPTRGADVGGAVSTIVPSPMWTAASSDAVAALCAAAAARCSWSSCLRAATSLR